MAIKLHQLPPRIACGAFILNTGISKRSLDAEKAAGLRDQAALVIPQLKKIEAKRFGKLLSTFEIGLGAALIVPFVPTWLVSVGLIGFSGMLMGVYLRTPGMTLKDGIRPAPEGMAIARDVFMLGSGTGLLVEELADRGKSA